MPDRDELARVIARVRRWPEGYPPPEGDYEYADAILASPWMQEHDRALTERCAPVAEEEARKWDANLVQTGKLVAAAIRALGGDTE